MIQTSKGPRSYQENTTKTKKSWTVTGFHIRHSAGVRATACYKVLTRSRFCPNCIMATLSLASKPNTCSSWESRMSSTWLPNSTLSETNTLTTWILICTITMKRMLKSISDFPTGLSKMPSKMQEKFLFMPLHSRLAPLWHLAILLVLKRYHLNRDSIKCWPVGLNFRRIFSNNSKATICKKWHLSQFSVNEQ